MLSNHHKENRQDSRQEIREPNKNHKTECIAKQVIENSKKKEYILIKKKNERSMAVVPHLFSPSSSKNLLSFSSGSPSWCSSLFPPFPLKLLLFDFQRENPEKRQNSPFLFFLFPPFLHVSSCSFLPLQTLFPLFLPPVFPSNLAVKRPAHLVLWPPCFWLPSQLILGF